MTTDPAKAAREKLIESLRHVVMPDGDELADWLIAISDDGGESELGLIANAILAAFPQLAPVADGEAMGAARRIIKALDHPLSDRSLDVGDVETVARYILTFAPGKDVLDGARAIVDDWTMSPDDEAADTLTREIAAFATAWAAKEVERVFEWCARKAENRSGSVGDSIARDIREQAAIRARTTP